MNNKTVQHTEAGINLTGLLRQVFPKELIDKIWLVGGSVRDIISGRPVHDIDLLTELGTSQLVSIGFRPVDSRTTVPILFKTHPQLHKIEISLLADGQGIDEELKRRDFSCNAVALSLDGILLDPLGGCTDIDNRMLTPCTDHSLADDPMRIFRAFRFACNGWQISVELDSLIKGATDWDQRLKEIPIERFSREMLRAMETISPDRFFALMAEYGVGGCYLPELFRMQQIPAGPAQYHGNNTVLSHSLNVLRRMSEKTTKPVPRLAAFLHDLGKLETPQEMLPRHIGHDKAGAVSVRKLSKRLRLSTAISNALAAACSLHMNAARWHEMRDTKKLALAAKAHKAGVYDWLPNLVSSDHGADNQLLHWDLYSRVAAAPATALGIEPAWLESATEAERTQRITAARLALLRKERSAMPETG